MNYTQALAVPCVTFWMDQGKGDSNARFTFQFPIPATCNVNT